MAKRRRPPRPKPRQTLPTGPVVVPAHSWDRWPGESEEAYRLFGLFSRYVRIAEGGMAHGVLGDFAEVQGVNPSSVRVYANGDTRTGRPTWAERVRDLEASIRDPLPLLVVPQVGEPGEAPPFPVATPEEITRSHATVWAYVRRLALTSLIRKVERGEELTAGEALKFAEAAVRWERLELGKVIARASVDLSDLPDEALAALEEAVQKAEQAASAATRGPETGDPHPRGPSVH